MFSAHSIEYRFFCNKFGWKDDLKELLREIYAFDKPGALMPDTIAVPAVLDESTKVSFLFFECFYLILKDAFEIFCSFEL